VCDKCSATTPLSQIVLVTDAPVGELVADIIDRPTAEQFEFVMFCR